MNPSIITKLETLNERYEELEGLLSDAEIITDQDKFRNFSKEYAELEPVVQCFASYLKAQRDLEEAKALQKDSDPDVREMAEEEISSSQEQLEKLDLDLQKLLL